jgi:serine/threonine protein kinase
MPSESSGQSEGTRPSTESGDLSGISEMFGLRDGQQAESGTRTGTDTVGRWVAATEGVDQPPDVSSRLVHGRYRLIAELGVGGMGVTYRAWDTAAGIPVVVKMPRREVRQDSEAMQRFAREIDAMLAVPHEDIVPITDHGDDDGCPFVVMRFLPGGSLADYRRRDEAGNAIRNPPGMLHFWLPGVAAALDHIHAKGMLHRDVKPGNIFLDGFLKPYLGDFGIAKVVDESGGLNKEQTLTATKMAVGTPEYMAPELFKPRSKPDGRVDQYALAVTVYEMLSGDKPFKGDRAHIIVEHSGLPVPPLAAKVPGLPQSLCMAVEKGLAKKSEDRFSTCREFAAAVLAELAVLPPEPDTVRLLCPSCKNILKLPKKAAGKTGKCPRCQTAMDVAADLGSLWLESEERDGGPVVTAESSREVATPQYESLETTRAERPGPWSRKPSWIAVLAACLGLAAGYGACVLHAHARVGTDFAYPVFWFDETDSLTSLSVAEARSYVQKLREDWRARVVPLSFDAVTSISPEVARELAQAPVDMLSLDGLTTMPPAVASELGAFSGGLTLNGLKGLAPACVPLLCANKNLWLQLNGLEDISPDLATALAAVPELSLDGLETIEPATAKLLATNRGSLSLGGLADLPVETVRHLATTKDSFQVSVGGNLTAEVAAALAPPATNQRPRLSLRNVGSLSVAAAGALPRADFHLHRARLSAESVAVMQARKMGEIGLEDPVDLTPAVAKMLVRHPGGFYLCANAIRDDVARVLVEPQIGTPLTLHVPELAPTTARILATSRRPIELFTQRMSVESAAALADHQSTIRIFYSVEYSLSRDLPPRCSSAALEILKSSGGIELPNGAFSAPSFIFTRCATGFPRLILRVLWGAFVVGLLGLLLCGFKLRRLGRQPGGVASAATIHSVSNTTRMARYAMVTSFASLLMVEFIVMSYGLRWGESTIITFSPWRSAFFGRAGVMSFTIPLVLWLLLLAAFGSQARRAWGQVKAFAVVGKPKPRYVWWGGVVVLFFVCTASDAGAFEFRSVSLEGIRSFYTVSYGDRQGMLLCLLLMAAYSLLRPGARWVLAIANALLAVMIVDAAWLALEGFPGRRLNAHSVPDGLGLVTVAWAIPLAASWFLACSGRFMMALFGSPHGGTTYHVCSSEGVAVDSAWVVPWSAFSAYAWDDDRLVLHRAGRFVLKKILSGTVPAEERVAADALLASRLPKAGGRGG